MALTTLDQMYSCSFFGGNNQTPDEVIQQFEDVQAQCLEQNAVNIDHQFDISYGTQTFDIWGDSTAKKLFVFVHGGYWTHGDKRQITSVVPSLVKNGIDVACVGYDLAPSKTLPEIVGQIADAIKFIATKYWDLEITVCGHSAGAHLVLKALERCRNVENVTKVVLICGIYKLTELVDTYIGRDMNLTTDVAEKMSVEFTKIGDALRDKNTLILTAEHDAPKIKAQNDELIEKLNHLSIEMNHKIIIGTNHFTMVESLRNSDSETAKVIVNFIRE